jgi:hypothetical protein
MNYPNPICFAEIGVSEISTQLREGFKGCYLLLNAKPEIYQKQITAVFILDNCRVGIAHPTLIAHRGLTIAIIFSALYNLRSQQRTEQIVN